MGSVYQRGRIWWVKYYQDGKPYRESSGCAKKAEAQQLLKKREGSIATGTFTDLRPERTMFRDLAADLLNDYSNNQRKSLEMVQGYVVRLGRYFGKATRRIKSQPTKCVPTSPTERNQRPISADHLQTPR